MAYVITFGRTDTDATKHLFRRSRLDAIETANALSFVLFLEHRFKASECHRHKRVEQGGFFVEFDIVRNPK
jgi:hypothetical protein